jgi:hypothetical protein
MADQIQQSMKVNWRGSGQPMAIGVYIDNNVWDFLFSRNLDLSIELPREDFCVCLTREAEFEIPPIPSEALKAFIDVTINKCVIRTDSFFGFNDETLPQSEQRVAGFDVGRWAAPDEIAFISQQRAQLRPSKKRKSKLYKDEADISLAARSFHSVVLSLDAKTGPINDAYKQGGRVVFLADFDSSCMLLAAYVKAALTNLSP